MLVSIALLGLTILGLTILGLAYWVSDLLLYARRRSPTRTPSQVGMDYEEVVFKSKDGLTLHGWWIPASATRELTEKHPTIILLHPLFGNRQGVQTRGGWPAQRFGQNLDLLSMACSFHRVGYAVLMFDFRSHGASQRGMCSGGPIEQQDVAGAVAYVFERYAGLEPGTTPPIGVVGFGTGAAAAIAAIGRDKGGAEAFWTFSADNEGCAGWTHVPPSPLKQLRFLVAVQPASQRTLVRGYFRGVAAPLRFVVLALVDRLCWWRGGYPLQTAFLAKAARNLNLPVLYILAPSDPWGDEQELQAVYQATSDAKQLWRIEEPLEGVGAYAYVAEHPARVLAFAAEALRSRPATQHPQHV